MVLNSNKDVDIDVLEDAVDQFDKAFERLELSQENYEILIEDEDQHQADINAMHDLISKAPRIAAGAILQKLSGGDTTTLFIIIEV